MRSFRWAAALALLTSCTSYEQATDFDPATDAPAFANAGGVTAPGLLDSATIQRLFGPAACESGTDTDAGCALIPEAEHWALQFNQSLAGGRCEGLAALSQAVHQGVVDPAEFGAAVVADLSEGALQRELAYWSATQSLTAVAETTEALDAREALRRLAREFRNGDVSSRLGLVRPTDDGPSGGHALTPYAIEAADAGAYDVLVYDPNHPGEARRLTVDPDAGTWRYQASASDEDAGVYEGGPDDPLWLAPLEARLGTAHCLLCDGGAGLSPTTSVLVGGPVQPTVGDCAGEAVGATDAGFVWSSDVAVARPHLSQDLWNDAAGVSFSLADVPDVCVDASGRAANADERDHLSLGVWRTGRRLAFVSGPVGGGDHALESRDDGLSVTYRSTTPSTGPLKLSGTADDGTRLFVGVETEAAVQTLGLALQPAEGDAVVSLGAADDQAVRIEVLRTEGLRRERFVAVLDPQPAGATLAVRIAAWPGDGADLAIDVDDDGDGSVDRTLLAADCASEATCPLLGTKDHDAVPRADDNCPDAFNPTQDDADDDGFGDACDPCPEDPACFCAAGTWQDDASAEACAACAPGEYCAGGDEAPEACGGLDFDHDLDPSTPCRPCDPGFTSPDGLVCQ